MKNIKEKKCKNCKGRGLIQIAENKKGLIKCPNCKGTGVEECFISTKKA
jgi:DnaJ-class molecular chaperone